MSAAYPPLLKVPIVPFEMICKKLEPADVFSLSLSSIISNLCVRNYGRIPAVYIDYQITKTVTKVVASITDKVHVDVTFRRLSNPEWNRRLELINAPGGNLSMETIKGVPVLIKMLPRNHMKLYYNRPNTLVFRTRLLKLISDKIIQIFPTDNFQLKAKNIPSKSLFCLLKVLPKTFESFNLEFLSDKENDKEMMGERNMRRLLEDYTIHRFNVDWRIPENWLFGGPLTHKHMEVFHGNWVTIYSILRMECIEFQANFTKLTLYECNRFLRSWFTGGFLELEKLDLYLAEPDVNYPFVLTGLPGVPWDSDARPRRLEKFIDSALKPETMEITNGMDLVREDGKLATVYLKRQFFRFYVWN